MAFGQRGNLGAKLTLGGCHVVFKSSLTGGYVAEVSRQAVRLLAERIHPREDRVCLFGLRVVHREEVERHLSGGRRYRIQTALCDFLIRSQLSDLGGDRFALSLDGLVQCILSGRQSGQRCSGPVGLLMEVADARLRILLILDRSGHLAGHDFMIGR